MAIQADGVIATIPGAMFAPEVLTQVAKTIPLPPAFLTNVYFTDLLFYQTVQISCEFRKGHQQLAPILTKDRQGLILGNHYPTVSLFEPPSLGPARIFSAESGLQLFGSSTYMSLTPAQRAYRILAIDWRECDNSIVRRIEWYCAQLLFNGSIPLAEPDGTALGTIDFGGANRTVLSGTALWSATTTSNPLQDVEQLRRRVSAPGNELPTVIVFDPLSADLFQNHPIVADAYKRLAFTVENITPSFQYPGTQFIGRYRGAEYYCISTQIQSEAAVMENLIPANTILAASPNLGSTNFAAIASVDSDGTITYWSASRVPLVTSAGPNSNKRTLTMMSRPLPVPYDTTLWQSLVIA
jgi:hypothetical protein